MRCKGSIRASFEPKMYKIGPEITKLRPINQWEVAKHSIAKTENAKAFTKTVNAVRIF